MNKLQEEYGPKGLSIVAITGTNESKADTEAWVKRFKVQYPYAYEAGKLSNHFGVRGIPAAALVDADGKVVWSGHPAELNGKIIEPALKGALKKPIFDVPSFEGALDDAKSDAELQAKIRAHIDGRVARVKAAHEAGNLLFVREQGTRLHKQLGKLEQAAAVKELVDGIAKVENGEKIIAAQESVQKIDIDKLKKKKDGEKALDELKRIVKELPDTYAETMARAKMEELVRVLPGLK
ncbi:MAG: TlpA family protein disulfide reductase [Planctomycetota bacterium]|nr:MAG: TlpA family protein disulfide reductase [Planctomycetota bacterium]